MPPDEPKLSEPKESDEPILEPKLSEPKLSEDVPKVFPATSKQLSIMGRPDAGFMPMALSKDVADPMPMPSSSKLDLLAVMLGVSSSSENMDLDVIKLSSSSLAPNAAVANRVVQANSANSITDRRRFSL